MIKKILILFLGALLMISCGSSQKVIKSPPKRIKKQIKKKTKTIPTTVTTNPTIADKIVWTAVTYKGVPYKYAGTSNAGMDCSGLIYTSFKKRNVFIPRTSEQMFASGVPISLKEVKRGDLLFFKTSRKRGRVNHVGLVTSAKKGDIRFIHSTSSRGVIVTSLNSRYWKRAFVGAKRVL